MSTYASGRDLKNDVLFRASEALGGASRWDSKIMDYLNRAYRTMAMGASEFLPEKVDDWWWTRRTGILTLVPPYSTGTLTMTRDTSAVVASDVPPSSLAQWKLRLDGHPDIYTVNSQVGAAITLDSPFTGESGSYAFKAMKVRYNVPAMASLISPMYTARRTLPIIGLTPERMDQLWPRGRLMPGIPQAFSLETDTQIRFSSGGMEDNSIRVDYRYRPRMDEILDADDSNPLVPLEYRHILSDMALTYLATDKNDNRVQTYLTAARAGMMAMFRENRRRLAKIDPDLGHIYPRMGDWGIPGTATNRFFVPGVDF